MAIGERIQNLALELLSAHPEGIRYSELKRQIEKRDSKLNPESVRGNIWNIDQRFPGKVYKPARGLFRLTKFEGHKETVLRAENKIKPGQGEIAFYQPFADWLVEQEVCNKAITLGHNLFRDKWGTPDVIGTRKKQPGDILDFPPEIVSAEIKTNSNGLITAYGQSCAYTVFSHKTFLVVPKAADRDDIFRLVSLCELSGIGLIVFDWSSPENPDFETRVSPRKHEPDMYFTNKNMQRIANKLFG